MRLDVFINRLPDHRINIVVVRNAGALIAFMLDLKEPALQKYEFWEFVVETAAKRHARALNYKIK